MNNKCLYCNQKLQSNEHDFHRKCLADFFGIGEPPIFDYSLKDIPELAKNLVERHIGIPGVQPKLSMGLVREILHNHHQKTRLTVVGVLGGNYIFKPPSENFAQLPANEHLTMQIARAFGIATVDSSLIRLKSGELSYITKRIDRTTGGEKIHMLDMFQITDAVDKYKSSMEKIAHAIKTYSDNMGLDCLRFFELSLFSFLTGNNDMHLKNFSMITRNRQWFLAPAYDLLNVTIANPEDREELALTLGGKKSRLTRKDFEGLGQRLDLNGRQIKHTFEHFFEKKELALSWIGNSFLSADFQEKFQTLLQARYQRIFT